MAKKIQFFVYLFTVGLVFFAVNGAMGIVEGARLSVVVPERESGTWAVGEIISANIQLDTRDVSVDGVDIHYFNYPQELLEAQDSDSGTEGVQIEAGILFPNTVKNEVLVEDGKIDFSQITAGGQQFSGEGVLATINFKVIGEGMAVLDFDFEQGNTTDSNVASAGQDALEHAQGRKFILGTPVSTNGTESLERVEPESPAEPSVVSGNGEETGAGWDLAGSKTALYVVVPLLVVLVIVLLLLRKRKKDIV